MINKKTFALCYLFGFFGLFMRLRDALLQHWIIYLDLESLNAFRSIMRFFFSKIYLEITVGNVVKADVSCKSFLTCMTPPLLAHWFA